MIEQILNYLLVGFFLGCFLAFCCFGVYALFQLWKDDDPGSGGSPTSFGSGPFGSYSGGEWGE